MMRSHDVEREVEVARGRGAFLDRARIWTIQRVPTRQGVHLPHDSCM